MANYRITIRARRQLTQIYDYTDGEFGTYQADAYAAGLIRTFGLSADFPAIGQTVDDFREGLRRFRFQSHFITTPYPPRWWTFAACFTTLARSGPACSTDGA